MMLRTLKRLVEHLCYGVMWVVINDFVSAMADACECVNLVAHVNERRRLQLQGGIVFASGPAAASRVAEPAGVFDGFAHCLCHSAK